MRAGSGWRLGARQDRRANSRGSREGEGEKARAQQHQTACGQCEKAVGNEVNVAHVTPAALACDVRAGSIKIVRTCRLETCRLKSIACCPRGVRPSCGSLQMRGPGRSLRSPDPSVPKPSRSSSNSRFAPATEKTRAALHSQKNSRAHRDNGGGVRIWRNSLSRTGTSRRAGRAVLAP